MEHYRLSLTTILTELLWMDPAKKLLKVPTPSAEHLIGGVWEFCLSQFYLKQEEVLLSASKFQILPNRLDTVPHQCIHYLVFDAKHDIGTLHK